MIELEMVGESWQCLLPPMSLIEWLHRTAAVSSRQMLWRVLKCYVSAILR